MTPKPPIVIALGGNAISREGEEGNIDQQFAHTRETAEHLARLIAEGETLVVTHGNGPQVGNIIRRVEIAATEIYTLPLHICVADTQAGMGYMISQCLENALAARGIDRSVGVLVTKVEVDLADPAFQKPTKPIGPFYTKEKAEPLAKKYNWLLVEVRPGVFRRVVASPMPKAIVEIELIRKLAGEGQILIAAGGGGVPVARDGNGQWSGVDVIVDKDRTSALLARELGAETLVIVTGVEKVVRDYGKPGAKALDKISTAEARAMLAAGQFPAGSMGPKIEGAIDFVEMAPQGAAPRAVITDLEHLYDAVRGAAGTRIVA